MNKTIIIIAALLASVAGYWFVLRDDIVVTQLRIEDRGSCKTLAANVFNRGKKRYKTVSLDVDLFDASGKRLSNMIGTVASLDPQTGQEMYTEFYLPAASFKLKKIIKVPLYVSKHKMNFTRDGSEIHIRKGKIDVVLTREDTAFSGSYRPFTFRIDPMQPDDFAEGVLVGIIEEKALKKKIYFTESDMQEWTRIYLVTEKPELIRKILSIGKNEINYEYRMRFIKVTGKILKPVKFKFKGDDLKFGDRTIFLDLEDIEQHYVYLKD